MKKIQSGGVVLVLALLLASAALIYVAAADGSQVYEGPGWRLEISENPLIDTSTGQAYSSAGAAIAAGDPVYWASIPDALRAKYEAVPAVQRQASLSLTPTPEQQERINALGGIEMSEAEYLSFVYPDLWEVVPEWQKEIWAGQPHRSSAGSTLSAGNPLFGSLTGTVTGRTGTKSTLLADPFIATGWSDNPFAAAIGDQTDPFTGFIPSGATSFFGTGSGLAVYDTGGYSILGGYPTQGNDAAEYSIPTGQSSAIGSIGSYASVLGGPGSSGLQYHNTVSADGNINRFGFSFAYQGW